jgi:hypothetical protein
MNRIVWVWPVILVLWAAEAQAQRPQGAAPAAEAAVPLPDSVDLRLERESFSYPSFARRNPFRPLLGDAAGPRFEDLQLLGVMFSSQEGQSVALLGIAFSGTVRPDSVLVESVVESLPGVEETRASRSRTNRMRVGDRWGNVRVAVIERNRVLVDVTEFGLTERRELLLRRPDAGGIR